MRDTFIPLKEKVKYMVEKESSNFETSILEKIETSRNPEIAQSNKVDSILLVKNTPKESNQDKVFEEEIFVSISSDKMLETTKSQSKSNSSFLAKLLGKSSIKIEPDHNTRTKRKIIFENKKYQIIAGF